MECCVSSSEQAISVRLVAIYPVSMVIFIYYIPAEDLWWQISYASTAAQELLSAGDLHDSRCLCLPAWCQHGTLRLRPQNMK